MSEIPAALGDGWLWKALGLVGASLAGTGAWFAGRRRGQSDFIEAVQQAAQLVIKNLQDECARVTAQCEKLEAQRAADHAKCEAELAAMQAKIDALMAQPIAGYGVITDPKRPG